MRSTIRWLKGFRIDVVLVEVPVLSASPGMRICHSPFAAETGNGLKRTGAPSGLRF